jgi:uncharacterized protein YdhG (YjbR/CyaY superfamily)
MTIKAATVDEYFEKVPEDRREALLSLRRIILENLPEGFEEALSYGTVSYVVPHSLYPAGYHVKPEEPLPFISIASQKHFIAVYHMGVYAFPEVLSWFKEEYPKHVKSKLDMGKSCIRFSNVKTIPYELIGELCTKIPPRKWIEAYEERVKK